MPLTRLLLLLLCLLPGMVTASETEQAALLARHQPFVERLQSGGGAMPIEVHSSETGDLTAADVFGVLEHPFPAVAAALADASQWCEFLPLSLNVKSCTYQARQGQTVVTLYVGRKHYQAPEEAYRLVYRFQVEARQNDFLKVTLGAEEGPLGARHARIELSAVPVPGATFVRVRVSHCGNMMSRLGAKTYLATVGKDKIGFSVVGRGRDGEPIYVKGMKGVIERNAVRYFLAMQAYLANRTLPAADRPIISRRLWFDLTEHYPAQLHEMEREEYLQAKAQEWDNQRRLQAALAAPAGAVIPGQPKIQH